MDIPTPDRLRRRDGVRGPQLVPALTLISHPLAHRVGERLVLEALAAGKPVQLSRMGPAFMPPGGGLGAPLADPFLSRKPTLFVPGLEGRVRLEPGEGGEVVVAGEPLRGAREFGLEALAAGVPLELAERVVLLLHLAHDTSLEAPDALGMLGVSAGLRRVRRQIEQVADLNVPVLIRGETGSGKELIAQAIHRRSRRQQQSFISVNLGAIPKDLAASELFGARKGAFTGAVQDRKGLFLAADGGTLFLDEVGEAPPEVQVLLLRVLETGEFYPVGAQAPVRVDVRLIAATDANLEAQIQEGRFKAPLLHRLAGYDIQVPPLRERREDIGLLFYHFARQELEALGEAHRLKPEDPYAEPWLPSALASRLVRYGWPGNIRQLRNVTRQLVIGSRGQPQLSLDAQFERELSAAPPPTPPPVPEGRRRKPSDISEAELLAALRESDWDLKPAADRLGISRPSIYDLIERHPNIRTAGKLSAEEIRRCYEACQGDLDAMARHFEVSKKALSRRVKELGLGGKGGGTGAGSEERQIN